MRIYLITDGYDAALPIIRVAHKLDINIIRHIGPDDEAASFILQEKPDAALFISTEIDRAVLREMSQVSQKLPLPIVVLTRDNKTESINKALEAGANSYVVDCHNPERIKPLLQVAKVRFDELQNLRKELDTTKRALADRKQIEKAKGIIMKQKSLNEEDAYLCMRKLAMDKNTRVADIAHQIILASEVLI